MQLATFCVFFICVWRVPHMLPHSIGDGRTNRISYQGLHRAFCWAARRYALRDSQNPKHFPRSPVLALFQLCNFGKCFIYWLWNRMGETVSHHFHHNWKVFRYGGWFPNCATFEEFSRGGLLLGHPAECVYQKCTWYIWIIFLFS